MTVIVEVDPTAAEALQTAVGRQSAIVPALEHLHRYLDEHPQEYAVIVGPSIDLTAAVALADTLRVTKPAARRHPGPPAASTPQCWPRRCGPGCARWSRNATSRLSTRRSSGRTRCTTR